MVKVKNKNETNKNIFGKEDIRINYHDNVNFHFWETEDKKGYYACVDEIINKEVVNMSDNCGKNTCKIIQKLFHSNIIPLHWQYFAEDRFSVYFFTKDTYVTPYVTLSEIRISDFDDTIELIVISGINKYTLKTDVKQLMKCSKIETHTIVKLREKGFII